MLLATFFDTQLDIDYFEDEMGKDGIRIETRRKKNYFRCANHVKRDILKKKHLSEYLNSWLV